MARSATAGTTSFPMHRSRASPTRRRSSAPDYLRDELDERLAAAPATFHLEVELAEDGDAIDDPTAVWPEGRQIIDVGRLELTGLANDRERDGDVLVFDPTHVPDGIRLTDDPILLARPGRLQRFDRSTDRLVEEAGGYKCSGIRVFIIQTRTRS